MLRGIVNGLDNRGVPRVFGTLIAYIVMFAVIALLCMFMFSPAFGLEEQIKDLIIQAPAYAQKVIDWAYDMYSQYSDYLDNETVQGWLNDATSTVASMGSGVASTGAQGIISFGAGVGNTLMALGIALVIAFWMLMELPALGREAKRFIKPKYAEDFEMWHYSFSHVMSGYIRGTFIQCAIIGVCSGILYFFLGIGNCAALGTLTGVLNIIPIVGP